MPEGKEAAGNEWRGRVGKLGPDELAARLAKGIVARLACLDHDGWPYVVPVTCCPP